MPATTLAMALSTFISQNKGANQRERIIEGVKISYKISIAWAAIATVLLFFTAEPLVALLSGSKEAVVIENGANYLKINAPFYSALGILLSLRNSLQGLGRKMIPLVSSVIEFFGKIIFVIILIPMLGYMGVMTAQLWYAFHHDPYIKGNA